MEQTKFGPHEGIGNVRQYVERSIDVFCMDYLAVAKQILLKLTTALDLQKLHRNVLVKVFREPGNDGESAQTVRLL